MTVYFEHNPDKNIPYAGRIAPSVELPHKTGIVELFKAHPNRILVLKLPGTNPYQKGMGAISLPF